MRGLGERGGGGGGERKLVFNAQSTMTVISGRWGGGAGVNIKPSQLQRLTITYRAKYKSSKQK